jgi:hypothetical protein
VIKGIYVLFQRTITVACTRPRSWAGLKMGRFYNNGRGSMKLILTDDDGVLLDEVDVHEEEFSYAQEDGGAATLLLGSLQPGRLA